jgi:hypothetical protein
MIKMSIKKFYADGGRRHSSAYADGNYVLTAILLVYLILMLCRRP